MSDSSRFDFFNLPIELALLSMEEFTATDLAAFIQTSKTSREIGLPMFNKIPIEKVLMEYNQAVYNDNHQAMVLLAPLLKAAGATDPSAAYVALGMACNSTCSETVKILVGDSYAKATEYERQTPEIVQTEDMPLFFAMHNPCTGPLETLVQAGAQLQDITYFSWTRQPSHDPAHTELFWLHHAAIAGMVGAAKLFLSPKYKHMHHVNMKDSQTYTPLILAAEHGNEAVVKVLLEHGANVNSATFNNRTPLIWASECGHEAVVRLLLEAGADHRPVDAIGRSALSWAAANGNPQIVQMLLDRGADTTVADEYHGTPLEIAIIFDNIEAVRALVRHAILVEGEFPQDLIKTILRTDQGQQAMRYMRANIPPGADWTELAEVMQAGFEPVLYGGVMWTGLAFVLLYLIYKGYYKGAMEL